MMSSSAAIGIVGIQTIPGELIPPVCEIKKASEKKDKAVKLCAATSSAPKKCANPANRRQTIHPSKQMAMSLGSTKKKHPAKKLKPPTPAMRTIKA